MCIAWVLSVSMVIQNVVHEQEHRLKEVMYCCAICKFLVCQCIIVNVIDDENNGIASVVLLALVV